MNEFAALWLWVLYCFLFGVYDGIQYYLNRKERVLIVDLKIHPHIPAFLMRLMVAAILIVGGEKDTWDGLVDFLGLGLMFPFFFLKPI